MVKKCHLNIMQLVKEKAKIERERLQCELEHESMRVEVALERGG